MKIRILRRIFGSKRDEIGEWRRLPNEELNTLYRSNIVRMINSRKLRWSGHVARMGEDEIAFINVNSKPSGKISLRRPSVAGGKY